MQSAHCNRNKSQQRIRSGHFIVYHTGIINQQITGFDGTFFIMNQIITCTAVNQHQFHQIVMGMHDAWVTAADIRTNFTDIEQLRVVIIYKNRMKFFFYKTLRIERLMLCHAKRSFSMKSSIHIILHKRKKNNVAGITCKGKIPVFRMRRTGISHGEIRCWVYVLIRLIHRYNWE